MSHGHVLILSAGRRVSLVRAFSDAVVRLGLSSAVLCADMRPEMSAACQVVERAVRLPHVLAPEYPEALERLCLKEGVSLVVPTIDTELAILSGLRDRFAALGVALVVSSSELVARCRDKRLTSALFAELGLAVPRAYDFGALEFPAFAKPISGSLSQGIRVLRDQGEVDSARLDPETTLFMELIDAADWEEVTTDAYYDLQGQLRCLVPRRRSEVRGGEISKGWADKSLLPLLRPPLEKIAGALGCLTVQLFVHRVSRELLGIEINPRFGGGFPLTDRAGARYPEWLLREHLLGQTLSYFEGWQDRLMMLRYDAEIWSTFE